MSTASARPYLIAAGGTGGHMFPALALAHELIGRGLRVLFVTDSRGARFIDRDIGHELIAAGSLSGSKRTRLTGALRLALGFGQSFLINLRYRPLAGACFGGYPSMPPGLAMALARVPFLLHEQNALLGKTNRVLARFAKKIVLSFEPTAKTEAVAAGTCVYSGNPVRPGFAAKAKPHAGERFEILILGGSQGARVFSDVVPAAISALDPDLQARLKITQQCRPEDLERVRTAYAPLGLEVELSSFFDDVPERMAAADLLITRSGASTVAEILQLGKPSILVPYAFAAEDHQRFNAERLAAAGAALAVPQNDFTAEVLAARLEELMAEPSALKTMAANARSMANPNAAARLADALLSLRQEAIR